MFLLGNFSRSLSFANTLYVDKNEIKIDASFKGDVINVYGIQEDGGNTIAVLKGKKATYFVQKKDKKMGIWLKGEKRIFKNIYRYYSIFSEVSLDVLNIPYLLKPFEIGVENISLSNNSIKDIIEAFEYKDALFKKKILDGLFAENYNKQISTPERLIYAQFYIPQNIPEGDYVISVYTILDGEIQSISNIPIYIKQAGLLKFIKSTASENKTLYFALSFGFSVGMAFLGYILLSGKLLANIKINKLKRRKKRVNERSPSPVLIAISVATVVEVVPRKRGRPRKVKSETVDDFIKND